MQERSTDIGSTRLIKKTEDKDEFQVKENLSETPALSYANNYNHFILGFLKNGNGTTSIIDIPKDPVPLVTSLSIIKGYAGDKVIITGNNFGKTPFLNDVRFGGIKATVDTLYWDRTKLRVTVPSGLPRGKVPVVVAFDGQKSNASLVFENITVSGITSVAPDVGSPGDVITITGTNFATDPDNFLVRFGPVTAALNDIILPVTPTQIKVKVPENAVRGPNQVVSVVIQDVANDYVGFQVIRKPSILEAVPNDGGEEIISDRVMDIKGSNLATSPDETLTVRIGDIIVPAGNIESRSETKVSIKVPRGIDGSQRVYIKTLWDDEVESPGEYKFRVGGDIKDVWLDNDRVDKNLGGTKRSVETNYPVQVEVYNRGTVKELKFWSKGISAPDQAWQSRPLPFDYENRALLKLEEADLTDDPLGLSFYFETIDSSTVIKASDTLRIFRDYNGSGNVGLIPELQFGGAETDYNIISIPYELSPNKINTVFKDILDQYGYDKSKWRIFHYKNENSGTPDYIEYLSGLDDIDPGKGYWIIVRRDQEISFDIGETLHADNYGPFKLVLNPGWNQIGNPYDFNISWDAIIQYNKDKGINTNVLETFKTFTDGSFQEPGVIDRFKGGFVRNNGAAVDLEVPFTKDPGINGRKNSTERHFASNLDKKEWRLSLNLSAGELKNRITSFGMHPQAQDGVDQRDEHKLPAFIQSLDLSFPHSLATSIVATDDHYTWDVEVINSTDTKEVTLSWDNTSFGSNDRQLYLQDNVAQRLIDMRTENHYTFNYHEDYSFKIHFGDKSYIEDIAKPSNVVLSDAYPNPMSSSTKIPFTVTKDRTHVRLGVYTLQGQELQTLVNDNLDPGFYEFEWDGKGTTGGEITSGVVIYRLQASESGAPVKSYFKKLVIKP
jgi:hypothetical protein